MAILNVMSGVPGCGKSTYITLHKTIIIANRGRNNIPVSVFQKGEWEPHEKSLLNLSRLFGIGQIVLLVQVFAVGGDDFLIPVEGILTGTLVCSVSFIVCVNVDESVTLAHGYQGTGYQIDTAPRGIADDIHAVFNGLGDCFDMAAEIGDPVIVVDLSFLIRLLKGSESVFNDVDRQIESVS